MIKYITTFLIISILTVGFNTSKALADSKKDLAEIYIDFGKGEYDDALKKAEALTTNPAEDVKAMAFYWLGQIYAKKQEYDKAIPNFQNALKYEVSATDVHYHLGQAFYASQEMEKAKEQFLKSYQKNFKPETSLYYAGYISQVLEKFKEASSYYVKIIKNKNDPEKIKKSAMYQASEIRYYLLTEEKIKDEIKKEKVINEILPLYKRAKEYDESDPLTFTITAKISQIQKLHQIDLTPRMRNGRLIPKDPFSARVGFDITYDSNIILRAEESTATPVNQDSLIYKISPFAKYQKEIRKTFFVAPEIAFSYKYHSNRSSPAIYKNDNYSIDPAIRNSFEHTLFNEKASSMFEIEYNYTAQDSGAVKELTYYSYHYQIVLGEKFTFFKIGETTFLIKVKNKESYTPSSESQTLTLNLSQGIDLPDGYSLTTALNTDFEHYGYAETSDTNTYKITLTPVIPKRFFTYYTIAPTVNVTITDTKKSLPSKGYEKTYNPSFKIKRSWGELNVDLSYAYTKKISNNTTTSAYTKHEVGLGTTYNF